MTSIDITIPIRAPTSNVYTRMHWAKRGRLAREVAWHILAAIGRDRPDRPLKRCKIHVERTSTKEPDEDGLIGSAKVILDALQPCSKRHPYGIGVIADDNRECVTSLSVLHVAGKGERTRIVITEAA